MLPIADVLIWLITYLGQSSWQKSGQCSPTTANISLALLCRSSSINNYWSSSNKHLNILWTITRPNVFPYQSTQTLRCLSKCEQNKEGAYWLLHCLFTYLLGSCVRRLVRQGRADTSTLQVRCDYHVHLLESGVGKRTRPKMVRNVSQQGEDQRESYTSTGKNTFKLSVTEVRISHACWCHLTMSTNLRVQKKKKGGKGEEKKKK